jgi:hypothetical protein
MFYCYLPLITWKSESCQRVKDWVPNESKHKVTKVGVIWEPIESNIMNERNESMFGLRMICTNVQKYLQFISFDFILSFPFDKSSKNRLIIISIYFIWLIEK